MKIIRDSKAIEFRSHTTRRKKTTSEPRTPFICSRKPSKQFLCLFRSKKRLINNGLEARMKPDVKFGICFVLTFLAFWIFSKILFIYLFMSYCREAKALTTVK